MEDQVHAGFEEFIDNLINDSENRLQTIENFLFFARAQAGYGCLKESKGK